MTSAMCIRTGMLEWNEAILLLHVFCLLQQNVHCGKDQLSAVDIKPSKWCRYYAKMCQDSFAHYLLLPLSFD